MDENLDEKLKRFQELKAEWKAKGREFDVGETFYFANDRLVIRRTSQQWLEDAYEIARIVHAGQVRKFDGEDYIHHPVRVALALGAENRSFFVQTMGLLHDTIEDGDGEKLLENAGFTPLLINKIKLLSKPEGMGKTDQDYLGWISSMDDPEVIAVKMADLKDNMAWRGEAKPPEKWLARKERYKKAWEILGQKLAQMNDESEFFE